jgi:hypothetical protein
MAVVASQLVDRVGVRTGIAALVPMLAVGAASVVYWRATERAGAGNLVPYAILQGYTVVVVLWLAIALPSRYTRGSLIYWIFAWYVLSKVLESFDHETLALGGFVSGHTLKHLAASMAGFVACRMLLRRTLATPAPRTP